MWYHNDHCHSGIYCVTPVERHTGDDMVILAHRKEVCETTNAHNPKRWSRDNRNWKRIEVVHLNRRNAEHATRSMA